MVREDKLSAVLSEFARTMATDFPIQRILDHLVERIIGVLPVSAAGVTLISGGMAPQYIAASDDAALRFEKLQTEIGQGPCLSAYQTGEAVAVPDLRNDGRYPAFGPAAVEAGLGAVFTFPLRHSDGCLGALDLYRDTTGGLSRDDMAAAQTLADVAAAYLLNAQARELARETSEQFRHNALHDPLTGLANRAMLQQRLVHAAQRAKRSRADVAIFFVDLDRFKEVNDTHGHQVGDDLLLAVALRLTALVRSGDTLARFAGDEFVFLCEDLHDPADAKILADRIDEAFAAPFVLGGLELVVTASVGTAFAGRGEDVSEQLLADADIAMYQAKRSGGGRHQVFDLREARQANDRHLLERELRAALGRDELDVAYQPIVRTADRAVIGVEALLRWHHPERGPVSPLSMVAVAEVTGLINAIGAWVLDRSCRARCQWLRDHPTSPLDLAVNLSGRQLMSSNFTATVAAVLDRTGMDPSALILEITENVLIDDNERAALVLTDLKSLGIRLALDDFGTGYSSLGYLRQLPIDIVKIDQGVIADIDQAPASSEVIAAVTDLTHALGLTVVAEGVETQRQHEAISAIGCECAQGFLYAEPMPADAIDDRLAAIGASPLRS